MSSKIDRATQGPGWGEMIFTALLSVVLGAVLGAVLLVLRPVTVAKTLPKQEGRDLETVYYIEGTREIGKSREAPAKRLAFAGGQSITLIEDELNALAGAPVAPGSGTTSEPPKSPDKAAGAAVVTDRTFAPGVPNFRLHEGTLQVGVPVAMNLLGLNRKIVVQTRGGFVKQNEIFAYEPVQIYVGSCPLERVPFLSGYVRRKFVTADAIPDDVKASWAKLAKVSIEGNALKLIMP